ncbi:MAG: hypothetical protein MRJ93_02970 [Nitrososphaeraceae archaeon]|nr:hypothetical protein [Nitrososphaeraceae archaeon]
MTGAYWDITYHSLNEVDNFFQPAHLVIYSSLFLVFLTGLIITIISPKKFLFALIPACQLLSGYFDLLWHNNFGFDSFLSPPHILLSFIPIFYSFMIFRYFQKSSNIYSKLGETIALGVLWLSMTFLLLMFSLVSTESDDISFYIIPPPFVSFIISFIMMPILSLLIVYYASLNHINLIYVAGLFAFSFTISTIIANPNVTFLFPFLLLGTILPAFLYNKNKFVGFVLFGGLWIFAYVPYSFKIILYSVTGVIVELKYTLFISHSLLPYYPLIIISGIYVGVFAYYITKNKPKLFHIKMSR